MAYLNQWILSQPETEKKVKIALEVYLDCTPRSIHEWRHNVTPLRIIHSLVALTDAAEAKGVTPYRYVMFEMVAIADAA